LGRTEDDLEISDSNWIIDSDQALQLAQENGGQEFLGQRPTRESPFLLLTRELSGDGQARTLWTVDYYDIAAGEGLVVQVDAFTGDIVSSTKS
jgi:hypothetical protein